MKYGIRVTLMTALTAILVLTVSLIGISAWQSAQYTTFSLARRMIDQISSRIEAGMGGHVNEAQGAVRALAARVRDEDFSRPADQLRRLTEVARFCCEANSGFPSVDGLYFGLERDGTIASSAAGGGGSFIADASEQTAPGKYRRHDFKYAAGRLEPDGLEEDWAFDSRTRPWYRQAREVDGWVWTDTYLFNLDPLPAASGVTVAERVLGPDGQLLGVVGADFTLQAICEFLKQAPVGQEGLSFLIEYRADGSRRVVAYPDPDKIKAIDAAGQEDVIEVEALGDPRVTGLLLAHAATAAQEAAPGETYLHYQVGDKYYYGTYRPLGGEEDSTWHIGVVLSDDELLGRIHRNNQLTIAVGALALLLGLLISAMVSGAVARPLRALAAQARDVAEFHLDEPATVRSAVSEVDGMARAMGQMRSGLRSFERYVPADLVRRVLASGMDASLGGEHRRMTILFSDIAGFTPIAEQLAADTLVELLGEYLDGMTAPIAADGGTVDKYIGDAIMAFWGAPAPRDDHARAAVVAALAMQSTLAELRERWVAQGLPPVKARIGLHTGEVIVGNLGSSVRFNYTVIGDVVNLASRLEGLNKHYGTGILISEDTRLEIADAAVVRAVDLVSVKGKQEPVRVWEVLALADTASDDDRRLAELSVRALDAYLARDWAASLELCREIQSFRPEDVPAEILLDRCTEYAQSPPGDDWDGVQRMEVK